MVLLRPQVVMEMISKSASLSEIPITGLQKVKRGRIVWAKKETWYRNTPCTVGPYAHKGQLEVRAKFAELASKAKGKKGKIETDIGPLPPAAAIIHTGLKGFKAPSALPPEKYPSKLRRTAYTAAELKAILEKSMSRKT